MAHHSNTHADLRSTPSSAAATDRTPTSPYLPHCSQHGFTAQEPAQTPLLREPQVVP
ncbi:hypothetical protein [Arsenicicoccus bolidensis]|uniref:hypothetical protein n=1 Tax=Arsenicicoccus bolidensis TaxID=229480 RepID=UPI0028AC237B|nr:hypothetical protein [Arsenicicoccus bolidensis]